MRLPLTIRLILLLSSVLLGLGLVAPCMTIQPSFGGYDSWVKLLKPDLIQPTTYSILGGILKLLKEDSPALGAILLLFSVAFPALKLATLWVGLGQVQAGQKTGPALWITHHVGKFSMLDVMVIALIIVAMKALPGGTTISVGWGLFAFAGSVLLSIVASILVKRLEAAPPPAGQGEH